MINQEELVRNKELVLRKEAELFAKVKADRSGKISLNLGCGQRVLPGFVNIDKYVCPNCNPAEYTVEEGDISLLYQFADQSVDLIFAAHVFEHLSIRQGRKAIKEWARVLKPGGLLYLSIPDLELIAWEILANAGTDLQSNRLEWVIFTMFGYQISPDKKPYNGLNIDEEAPEDLGQFHKSGYTKLSLQKIVLESGFQIQEIFSYDGFGTWSIQLIAGKI